MKANGDRQLASVAQLIWALHGGCSGMIMLKIEIRKVLLELIASLNKRHFSLQNGRQISEGGTGLKTVYQFVVIFHTYDKT